MVGAFLTSKPMATSDSPSTKSAKQRANDAVENNAVERKAEAWLLHL